MKQSKIQTAIALLMLVLVTPINVLGFPIFAPPSAYANCKSSPSFFGDSANVTAGFAGGTATNVTWDGTKMVLSAAQTTGTFTSRVIDNGCLGVGFPWLNFQWTTTLPFGKEIPVTDETTTSYTGKTNSTLTSNLVGLWRFNESTSYNGTANEAIDVSGSAHHGTLMSTWGPVSNTKVAGLFNNAWNNSDGLPIQIPSAGLPVANIMTFSIWFQTSTLSAWTQLAQRDNGTNWWRLQITNTGVLDAGTQTTGGGGFLGDTTTVIDGKWHHVVLVLNNGTGALWLDGAKCAGCTGTYPVGTGFTASDLLIGNGTKGYIDEAAMWHRALSDAEVIELYRRGANRLRIQVRNCTSSTCIDNPGWQGPDGTATTYFTELNNNSNQLSGLGTVQAGSPSITMSNFSSVTKTNRYIQYKFILDTDNTTYSPDIKTIGPGK